MRDIVVILPNQLFEEHPCLTGKDPGNVEVYLVEEGRYFTDFNFHKKKLILHRASMKAYGEYLLGRGYRVRYIEYKKDWREMVAGCRIYIVDPCDTKLLKSFPETAIIHDSPAFIGGELKKGKKYLMGNYYKEQRRRLNILMEGGKPLGGVWSFDKENRKKLPKGHICPSISTCENKYIEEARKYVEKNFPRNPGDGDNFIYPVTFGDARRWLNEFIEDRLPLFGDYEDAIVEEEEFLYHSLLSPLLNIGLLTPMEVVERVLEAQEIPINSREGFIRQVIGWREFIRQIYLIEGERERGANYFENKKKLPQSFYTGTTGNIPVDNVIRKVVKNAYSHHIERLMILGNYMLLKGYHPHEIYKWFMEMYIDAYDWVMVPNLYGMSQFADGGIFATKPYISSSNYILKMSDFERGPWCNEWDELYWGFLEKHEEKLRKNPRMGLMMKQLERRRERKLEKKDKD